MHRKLGLWLTLTFFMMSCVALEAQQAMEATHHPPKVLVIVREWMKPGKAGSQHEKTESMFPAAFAAAKWPQHYLAMDSLSGAPRSLFLVGYESFEAWEKDTMATQKNATLAAALDRASVADGDMLSGSETNVMVYRPDLSHNPGVDIPHMRYFELSLFKVRPGHSAEWKELVKTYQDGYKDMPDAHWAVYESQYGQLGGGIYLVVTPLKSASEVDKSFGDMKKFSDTLGEEGMKKLSALSASCLESEQTNLFMFNPKLSYVGDDWKKADSFWQTGPAKSAAMAKKTETKAKP